MKNTARQSNALVRMPPKSTPAAMPMLATVPQMARAVARWRAGVRRHHDRHRRGVSIAAPAPWAPRARTSVSAESARPLTSEAPVKTAEPDEEHPAPVEQVGHPAAEQQQAAAEQHVGADRPLVVGELKRRSVPMLGSATFTTLTSRTTMNCAASMRPSTVQGRALLAPRGVRRRAPRALRGTSGPPGGLGGRRFSGPPSLPSHHRRRAGENRRVRRPAGRRGRRRQSRRFHRRDRVSLAGSVPAPVQPRTAHQGAPMSDTPRRRPSTSSSSAPARPASPRRTTSSSGLGGSSSSTLSPRSATPGAPGGTPCGSSRRRSTTGCPAWRSLPPPARYPTKDEVGRLPRGRTPRVSSCPCCSTAPSNGWTRLQGGFAATPARAVAGPPGRGRHRPVPAAGRPRRSRDLGRDVTQLHSSSYRNPDDLPAGPVVVVGAGNSGRQIALELAASHAGHARRRHRGPPAAAASPRPRPLLVAHRTGRDQQDRRVTARSPDARPRGPGDRHPAARAAPRRGRRPAAAGVRRHRTASGSRTARTPTPSTVVWATGFRCDYSWIDVPGVVYRGRSSTAAATPKCRACPSSACRGSTPAARPSSASSSTTPSGSSTASPTAPRTPARSRLRRSTPDEIST